MFNNKSVVFTTKEIIVKNIFNFLKYFFWNIVSKNYDLIFLNKKAIFEKKDTLYKYAV